MYSRLHSAQPRLISSGPDFLTATQGHSAEGRYLAELAAALIQEARVDGDDETTAKANGYEIRRAGGCSFGVRQDDVMISLSGPLAALDAMRVLPSVRNVSRIDLQATVELSNAIPDLALEIRDHLKATRAGNGRPLSMRLIDSDPAGQTLYIGAPTSDVQIRIYDKGVQSETAEPGVKWRWELQARRRPANQIAERLQNGPCVRKKARAILHAECMKRRLPAPWAPGGEAPLDSTPRETDAKRRLRYLETCIAPMVQKLVEEGFGAEVLAALDIRDRPKRTTKEEWAR